MSLLMQALKKAEQSKQLLTDTPSPRAEADGSMSPSSPEVTSQATKLDSDIAVTPRVEPSLSELSLSPRMDFAPESASSDGSADGIIDVGQTANTSADSIPAPDTGALPQEERDFNSGNGLGGTMSVQEPSRELANSDHTTQTTFTNEPQHSEKKASDATGTGRLPPDYLQAKVDVAKEAQLEQQKAKAVFSAKSKSNTLLWRWVGIGALFITIVIVGAAYVYLQMMNSHTTLVPVLPAPMPTSSNASGTDAVKVDAVTETASTVNTEASTQAPATDINPSTTVVTERGVEKPEAERSVSKSEEKRTIQNEPATNPMPVNRTVGTNETKVRNEQPVSVADPKNIQIHTNNSAPSLHPNLNQAYQALSSDDLNVADTQYRRVLQDEPNNRDALLGLATVSARRGQIENAVGNYLRLLELDPTDPDAIAGLASLQQGDLTQVESRLKKTLNQFPNASGILFALGNVYAQQSRWAEAQQMYFRAFSSAPANPDYAFNLAVSLDRLNQVKLAREYYQRALALTQTSAANFNKQDVRKRVQALDMLIKE